MPNTDSLVAICDFALAKINTNKVALGLSTATDIVNTFYGDQDVLQFLPAICVEPDTKRREFNGVRRRTQNDFSVAILVYHGKTTDPQTNRRQADIMAEAVETLFHADPQLGGLVISSLVESIESGYQRKGANTVIRTARVTLTGRSQTLLAP
jgi:hypothetical protein